MKHKDRELFVNKPKINKKLTREITNLLNHKKTTSIIHGLCGPAWNKTSLPPAPQASKLMKALTSLAHL